MIPTIGIMVGCYIIARMVNQITIAIYNGKNGYIVSVLAAVVTILLAIMSISDLMSTGSSASTMMQSL